MLSQDMKVGNLSHKHSNDGSVISATVGDETIWFDVNLNVEPKSFGDTYLTAALFIAMKKNQNIVMAADLPVSQTLLDNIEEYQTIYQFWYPQLKKINIQAAARSDDIVKNDHVGSFFSGGADSSFSFINHKSDISDLIFIHGLDMQLDNTELFHQVVNANQQYVEKFNKRLVVVKSNIRQYLTNNGVGWSISQGAGLASVAHLLGFHRTIIPATHTYGELFPWGSHPLTDRLLQSQSVQLKHDGAEARRSDKLEKIAKDPDTLNLLRVCWQDNGYNCGDCEKCIRTMLTLRILGVTSAALPRLNDLSRYSKLRLHEDSESTYVNDSLLLAKKHKNKELIKFLTSLDRKITTRKALVSLENAFFGGRLKSFLVKLLGKT